MRKYFIKRVSPNTGFVCSYGRYFEEIRETNELPYVQCKDYVLQHQEELTIYKVARILNRKNAKRTLFKRFLAADEDEAKAVFDDICRGSEDGTVLQLVTGDWKIIAEKDRNGLIKII